MAEVKIDSILALKLYNMIFGDDDGSSFTCPTFWKPTKDAFRDLINHSDSFNDMLLWGRIRDLPAKFSGTVIAKIIIEGVPYLWKLYYEDGHLHFDDYDCIVSYLLPVEHFKNHMSRVRENLKLDDKKIENILKAVEEDVSEKHEPLKLYALFLGDIQLTEWNFKFQTEYMKKGLRFKHRKTADKIVIKEKE